MRSSESTAAISEALVLLLADLSNPAKTEAVNAGRMRYSFAPLPDILNQVRPELAKCGLALIMETITDAPLVGVGARLVHISGEWLEVGPLMLPAGNDAQSAGSAVTYARRYLLCAVLGIAADEDDDGRAAAPSREGSTANSGRAAAQRPELGADGEAASGSGERSITGGGEASESDGTLLGPPPVVEPHDHQKGKQLASGSWLCSFELSDGTVCGEKFKPAPTVLTAPVEDVEVRKDIA